MVIHGLRGQPSKLKITEKVERRAMEIVVREYADFGPTLASEYLRCDHSITASREVVIRPITPNLGFDWFGLGQDLLFQREICVQIDPNYATSRGPKAL